MSEGEHFEVPARPVTTRVGGGLPPRIVALGVVGALMVVVTIAVAGRPEPSKIANPLADSGPSSTPSASPILTPNTPEPSPTPSASRTLPRTPAPAIAAGARYVATGTAAGQAFHADLVELMPGVFTGQYWLPDRPRDDELTFDIIMLDDSGALSRKRSRIGAWTLSLYELADNHRAGQESVAASVAARPKLFGAPQPIQRGYELGVYVRLTFDDVKVIDFEMNLGPRRKLTGDNGILSWPSQLIMSDFVDGQ